MKRLLVFIIIALMSSSALALEIKSDAFGNKDYIPDRYTCDAQDFSPALLWNDVPSGAKSLVLICDDPDAPFKIWVHWILFNIPVDFTGLKENIGKEELSELKIVEGINDFGRLGYQGPCPPQGKPHRYLFKLYALDIALTLEQGAAKKEVIEAMQGHILSETKIVGFYQRQEKEAIDGED